MSLYFAKSFWLVLGVFLCHHYGQAQKAGSVFHHLTMANGLSCNRVSVVMQDSRGFYWIGTEDGLNRFDGSYCKIFRNIKNDSTSISSNVCSNILEDANGDIWIATHMGMNRYDYKTGKFERFFLHHPSVSFDRVNIITGLQKDKLGNIWIASTGLWQYNIYTKQIRRFIHDSNNVSSIPDGIIWNLRFNENRNVFWMRTFDEYVMFDPVKEKFHTKKNFVNTIPLFALKGATPFEIDANNNMWLTNDQGQLSNYNLINNSLHTSSYMVSKGHFAISSDDASRIWIHYWFGETVLFNTKTQKVDSFFLADFHPQSALSSKARGIFQDKSGIIWICSSEGVSIYDPNEQAVGYFLLPAERRTSEGEKNKIYCMAEQDENTVWLGTNTGLCRYDLLKNKFRYLDHLPFGKAIIKCLYKQNNSTLWIGTTASIFLIDIKSEKVIKILSPSMHTEFITEDDQGNIWVGTWHNGLYKFSSSGQLLGYFGKEQNSSSTVAHNNMIGYQATSSKNRLWIGYNGGYGFSHLDYKTNTFSHYKIQTNEPHFSAINTVNCMLEEDGGNLWIGTNGGGLIYFDRKQNKFTIYSQSDGLKSNYINAILPDQSGRLWTATSNGLCIVNPITREITNLSIDLELGSNGFLPNGLLRNNKKMLFFAGSKLVEVNPDQLRQHDYPSKILFSSFKVFDKETSLIEKTNNFLSSLSYRQNFFSIDYSLLTPNPNSNTQYTYRLEGFDDDWIPVKERRVAYYTNVPPGSYTFQVKAVDASGKSYLSNTIEILIAAPFWKTWWFFCLSGLAIAALLFGFYRYRLNQVLKMERMRTRIATDLHDDIGATLSSISMYSDSVKDQIKEQLPHLKPVLEKMGENSRSMVSSMNDIVWAINPDNDEGKKMIERMESYSKDLCAVRNVRLQFFADGKVSTFRFTLDQRKNIYLVFKEALNNALKYAECNLINVDLHVVNKEIVLSIRDNGKGISQLRREGNGLRNMKMRAAEINGKIRIESLAEGGTTVTLQCSIA